MGYKSNDEIDERFNRLYRDGLKGMKAIYTKVGNNAKNQQQH